jgi:anti-sigma factor RsiW
MNKCTDSNIQEMLPDLLHRNLADGERLRVEAHLATCESCQEDLEVLRIVKSAAVFAPSIDVDRVVRQIPPYRTIVPAVEAPARTQVRAWLVAATMLLAVVGGGSVLVTRQRAADNGIATAANPTASQLVIKAPPSGSGTAEPIAPPKVADPVPPPHPHALALAADADGLSDGNLVQLMNEMDGFDALPGSEPDPVISVDSGDSL